MKPELLFFDRIHNRYRVEVALVARTGMRVGQGRSDDAAGTDLPVLRVGGEAVVPGSSWKGVLRSACEQVLRSAAPLGQMSRYACNPFGDPPKPDKAPGPGEEPRGGDPRCLPEFKPDEKLSAGAKVEAERKHLLGLCEACQLFGAPGLGSRVRARDSVLTGTTRIRDGVGLDRDLGRARDRIKYDFEIVEPGASATLVLDLDNVEDWQLGLILGVLAQLGEGGLRVGGGGSRGLGWLGLEGEPVVKRYDLKAILGRGEPQTLDAAAKESCLVALDDWLTKISGTAPGAEDASCTA